MQAQANCIVKTEMIKDTFVLGIYVMSRFLSYFNLAAFWLNSLTTKDCKTSYFQLFIFLCIYYHIQQSL